MITISTVGRGGGGKSVKKWCKKNSTINFDLLYHKRFRIDDVCTDDLIAAWGGEEDDDPNTLHSLTTSPPHTITH